MSKPTENVKVKPNYHNRPEWSYSQMKEILAHGIDYAVAKKQGLIEQKLGRAVDIGTLTHQYLLGGEDEFVVKKFADYRTKEAREWRDAQTKPIISEEEFEVICRVAEQVKAHPHSKELLLGKGFKYEVELYATVDGIEIRGKADAVKLNEEGKPKIITDLKTTALFDDFKKKSHWDHYDLQAAVYTLLSSTETIQYYFCVAETVEPYRVQYMHAEMGFLENGEGKLQTCLAKIKDFGDREPNFLLEEIVELGDYSL
jgi:hypothetical protein